MSNYAAESIFRKYLDNSADYATLEVEIAPLQSFQDLFEMMQEADAKDTACIQELMSPSEYTATFPDGLNVSRAELFELIRNVWDIAYSYGVHDAQAEAGLTLEEMETF